MEDLFKKLFEGEELPKELKGEVKNTLDTAKMLLNVTDLFTGKFIKTEVEFFSNIDDENIADNSSLNSKKDV